jgi:Domain of unknown function (DUF4386)
MEGTTLGFSAVGDTDAPSVQQQHRYARVGGLALLVICLSGLLGNDLIVSGDAATTARNILGHERRFRVGIAGELLMLNGDILLAVALYVMLKPINAPLALLGSLWRLINATLLAVGVVASLLVLDALRDPHYLSVFTLVQMQATAWQSIDLHGTAMEVGLIFFGLGASIHAGLLWSARLIPRLLSGAYVVVTSIIALFCTAVIVFPDLEAVINPWLIAPDFIVELIVGLWLTVKGTAHRSTGISTFAA